MDERRLLDVPQLRGAVLLAGEIAPGACHVEFRTAEGQQLTVTFEGWETVNSDFDDPEEAAQVDRATMFPRGMVIETVFRETVLGVRNRFIFENARRTQRLTVYARTMAVEAPKGTLSFGATAASELPEEPSVWADVIEQSFPGAAFQGPAVAADIGRLEEALGIKLPDELRSFLETTNGLESGDGDTIVWSVDEIIVQNREFRSNVDFRELYMPFDCLLFFAADAGGDRYAYRILNGQILPTSWIFRWGHEDDNRDLFARDLEDYLGRRAQAAE